MADAKLAISSGAHGSVWRVGYRPDPWAWSDWKWATDGRFNGRWDDKTGTFRTLYVAESLVGCLLEVLAPLRPDPVVTVDLDAVQEDPQDALNYPTAPAGEVALSWLDSRCAGKAGLTGDYCRVTASESVATLRPRFISLALRLKRRDFDASALKDGATRELTQSISTFLFESTALDGVEFGSRLGDDLRMWAIFERPGNSGVSSRLEDFAPYELEQSTPELLEAFRLLNLRWQELPRVLNTRNAAVDEGSSAARIESRPWQDLPPALPPSGVRYCGALQVAPDGAAFLYVNDARHSGGFCQNPTNLAGYAADALRQFEVDGPHEQWDRLPDGSYITALLDEAESDRTLLDTLETGGAAAWPRKAPPRHH